jgi:hypothetical protein
MMMALMIQVAELTEELAEVNKKLEWEKGENGVLKKKHSSAIKVSITSGYTKL